jgi:2-isopropylmalate synthase
MQQDYGINLPRNLQVEYRDEIQRITDEEGKELPSRRIYERFLDLYVDQPDGRIKFVDHHTYPDPDQKGRRVCAAEITDGGVTKRIEGHGNGPIDGFVNALSIYLGIPLSVEDYSEHSLQHGSDASAIAYVEMKHPGGKLFGVGINTNIVAASLSAVVSAANRVLARQA